MKEIKEIPGNKVLSLCEEQKRTLLDSLRFEQIDIRQLSIKNAHAKTCRWLLRQVGLLHAWQQASGQPSRWGVLDPPDISSRVHNEG